MPSQKAILRDISKHGLNPQKKYTKTTKIGELVEESKEKKVFASKVPALIPAAPKEEELELPEAKEETVPLETKVQVAEEKIEIQEKVVVEKPKKKGFQKKQVLKDD